jgi:hypothetical protein
MQLGIGQTAASFDRTAEIFVDCTVNGLNPADRTLELPFRLTRPWKSRNVDYPASFLHTPMVRFEVRNSDHTAAGSRTGTARP